MQAALCVRQVCRDQPNDAHRGRDCAIQRAEHERHHIPSQRLIVQKRFHLSLTCEVQLLINVDVADQLICARIPFRLGHQFDRVPTHLPDCLLDVDAHRTIEAGGIVRVLSGGAHANKSLAMLPTHVSHVRCSSMHLSQHAVRCTPCGIPQEVPQCVGTRTQVRRRPTLADVDIRVHPIQRLKMVLFHCGILRITEDATLVQRLMLRRHLAEHAARRGLQQQLVVAIRVHLKLGRIRSLLLKAHE
eukprot:6922206-Prymnesium_polylepis.2